jgi:hypothetical protein
LPFSVRRVSGREARVIGRSLVLVAVVGIAMSIATAWVAVQSFPDATHFEATDCDRIHEVRHLTIGCS